MPTFRDSIVPLLVLTIVIAGCSSPGGSQVPGAIAQAESFNFRYVKLRKAADGTYPVMIQFNNRCEQSSFDEAQLLDVFRTGLYPRTIGGGPVNVGFTFDLFAACNTVPEVRYETRDLVEAVADANGNVTYHHPHSVDAGLSAAGALNIAVYNLLMFVFNASQVQATGPMALDRIDVPGDRVGGAQGDTYSTNNVTSPFFIFNLSGIYASPGRLAGDFAFTAKKTSNDDELLVVWDGDFVLRNDI
ncbi:MAG: hypothetical protein JWN13_7136 [Betaproteobacteria bacterium]|nr:hypothetical protein [Betaproteobacteria bacterium]